MSVRLSPAQQTIVEAPDGHYLVVASAGSGKTRVLTERVRHLLEVRKTRSRILALTFTNKAAEEMRQRLADVPDVAERAYIGTIHSFCQTILEAHGSAVGYATMPAILERESDRIAMLEEVITQSAELATHLKQYTTPKERRDFLYRVLGTISLCKRDPEAFARLSDGDWDSPEDTRVLHDYQRHLASHGVIDFDDILLLAYRILSERPGIASIYHRTYRYLFVDEAQDLNPVQYGILRLLGEQAASIMLVGDPNQAIFGFNGSSKEHMLRDFPEDFGAKKVELRENFRSSRAVVQAANALYPGSMTLEAAVEGAIELASFENETAEALWVTDRIEQILTAGTHPDIEGTVTPQRIAVLARNRYVFAPLQACLEQRGIAYQIRNPGSGLDLESKMGVAFDLGLRILVNPRNQLHYAELRRRLGVPPRRPWASATAMELLEDVCISIADSTEQIGAPLLEAWRAILADPNAFGRSLDFMESSVGRWDSQADGSNEERLLVMGDLGLLRTIWSNYSRATPKESRSLAQLRNQMATGAVMPLSNPKGITLASVHASKGLEYDVVFIMGWVEGGFPDYRAVRAGPAALTEEKNDAFVALTRSKRLLYLTWPMQKFMPWDKEHPVIQRKSRFLEEIERHLRYPAATQPLSQVAEQPRAYKASP
jgi:DNA helicase II / ATP-dependent DNA helicase PcrA